MIRKIRDLLYDQGFTISGARNKLHDGTDTESPKLRMGEISFDGVEPTNGAVSSLGKFDDPVDFEDSVRLTDGVDSLLGNLEQQRLQLVRRELFEIRDLLSLSH